MICLFRMFLAKNFGICVTICVTMRLSYLQVELPWEEDTQPLAWEDRTPASFDSDSEDSDASEAEAVQQPAAHATGRKPVWNDPDDMSARVNIAAQPRLRKLRKTEKDSIVSGTLHSIMYTTDLFFPSTSTQFTK